jgi:hypothetical protein
MNSHPKIAEEETDILLTPSIDLASLNSKDDSYMITQDGQFLVFLTYNEIVKYSLKEFKIVRRETLAPLLFPFLKKMTVRKRNLLISSCGNKILGIICEDAFKGHWFFLIYDVNKKKCQRKYLGGAGTRGGPGLANSNFKGCSSGVQKARVGEKVKEWIIADGWKDYIFYKVERSKPSMFSISLNHDLESGRRKDPYLNQFGIKGKI